MTQFFTGVGGALVPLSGAATRSFIGTKAAELLTGTSGNDAFRGAGGGDTLVGGAGDDTYNVFDAHDTPIENANEGIDTVTSTVSFTLGANIENLTLFTDQTYGGGNGLNNIINGGAGSQLLDGKGGSDVLTGGAGADVFVMALGGGKDVITDFQNGVDAVRLDNFGLTSFGQVQALMVQQGSDVALNLSTGEELLFRSHQVSDFSAADFKLQVDTSNMTMTFDDEFDALSLNTGVGPKGTWRTSFGGAAIAGRTLSSNAEKEIYVDADYTGTGTTKLGINPFSLNNGVLDITAAPASAQASAAMAGYQYTSGLLTTRTSFAQQYGYFEVRAKLPAGQGLWPAFWLLPANGTWPPEIDIFEQLGNDPTTIHETSHSTVRNSISQVTHVDNPDQFHTYGMLWDQNYLVWTIDGVEVNRQTTPSDMNQPMYILLNLAVGGTWPGNPNSTTPFPATMSIDYVHVYQLNGLTPGSSNSSTAAVIPPNQAPVASNTSASGQQGSTIGGTVSASDPDGNALTYALVNGPTHGALSFHPDGSFTYTPTAGYNGADSFSFEANDGSLNSNVAAVSLTVAPLSAPLHTHDFTGDGKADLLFRHAGNGDVYLWTSSANGVVSPGQDLGIVPLNWQIQEAADFTGDGKADILWRNLGNGDAYLWTSSPNGLAAAGQDLGIVPLNWQVQAAADFNGDGKADILWRNMGNGDAYLFTSSANAIAAPGQDLGVVGLNWHVQAAADFNGDGKADILWRNTSNGDVYLWTSSANSLAAPGQDLGIVSLNWQIQEAADYNGDGKADILWRNSSNGDVYLWDSSPGGIAAPDQDLGIAGPNWQIQAATFI